MESIETDDDQLAQLLRRSCSVSSLDGIGSVTVIPGRRLTEIEVRSCRAIAQESGVALVIDESGAMSLRREAPASQPSPHGRRRLPWLHLRSDLGLSRDGAAS